MVSPWIRLRPCVLAGVLALGVAACRGPRIVAAEGGSPVDPVPQAEALPVPVDEVRVAPRTLPVAGNAVAIVEPGVYRADARFAALADAWSSHVAEAITLLDNDIPAVFRIDATNGLLQDLKPSLDDVVFRVEAVNRFHFQVPLIL